MDYDKIPAELRQRAQWVCHRYPNKMPLCPIPAPNGKLYPANCAARETWGTFAEAVRAVREYGATGIGIEFADGLCGVDIDHCVEDGEPSAMAKEIIGLLSSYTEFSPSGTGIHILCQGSLPDRDGNRDSILGLEMYDKGRYFTVTGNVYCDEDGYAYPLRDCTKQIDEVHRKYLTKDTGEQLTMGGKGPNAEKRPMSEMPPARAASGPSPGVAGNVRDLTDEQLLEIAFRAKNGEDFRRLYEGNWSTSEYPSQSEADYALVCRLAFWLNHDGARMDRVFRASGLMRPKWDRSVGHGITYGQRAIERAIDKTPEAFIPVDRPRAASAKGGRNDIPLPEPPPYLPGGTASSRPKKREAGPSPPKEEWTPPPPSPPTEEAIKPDPTEYTFDDTGNAYRFRDAFYQEIKYDHTNRVWLYWTGQQWTEDKYGFVKLRVDKLLSDMRREAADKPEGEGEALLKHFKRSRSSKAKIALLTESQHLEGITIRLNKLDCHKDVINVKNGIVDLRTGELCPHDREMYLSMMADVDYDPAARCPLWLRFLDDITEGDTELQLYLQRVVGYCLTGSTAEQCLYFLYGTGANGKSTFVNILSGLLGDYTKNAQADTIMKRDRGSASAARSDVARLKGARLVSTSEPDGGCQLDEGMVKQMTGDDIITTRRLYKEEFDFRPEFKIIMATNVKPIIRHSDHGIWRRVRMVPFTARIPEERRDMRLLEKLQGEKPGIFQWALAGAVGWYREGMPACTRVTGAIEEYRKEMDKVRQFMDDCLVVEKGKTLQTGDVYMIYRAWCAENGERYPLANNKFSSEMQNNCGFARRKTNRCNEYLDIELTEMGTRLFRQGNEGSYR